MAAYTHPIFLTKVASYRAIQYPFRYASNFLFAINAITAVPSRAGRVCDCGNYYIAMFQAAAAAILGKFIVCLF